MECPFHLLTTGKRAKPVNYSFPKEIGSVCSFKLGAEKTFGMVSAAVLPKPLWTVRRSRETLPFGGIPGGFAMTQ